MVECGEGRQERNVSCVNSKEVVIKNELCKNITKPATVRQCVKHCGKWKYKSWSPVSKKMFNIFSLFVWTYFIQYFILFYNLVSRLYTLPIKSLWLSTIGKRGQIKSSICKRRKIYEARI